VTWLISLYPPAWRRRYGRELAELIATQPKSFGMAIDLVAAAVDAWLNSQSSTAATAEAKGAGAMVPKMLQLRCAGYGPNVTASDARKAAAVMLGGSLAAALAYLWADAAYGSVGPYFTALFSVSWLVMFVFSQHYTTLKGRSGLVQTVLIGGQSAIVIAIVLAAAWISSN
jgi:hypothetical protein